MERLDYLCKDDGDILFEDGDLVVGESSQQHIEDIVDAEIGDYREFIMTGCAPRKYINAPQLKLNELTLTVKQQLTADNFKVKTVKLIDGEIKIDAR